jgi:hypothetical protein
MNNPAAARANAFWIDPRTGDSHPATPAAGTDVRTFQTPEGWEDALLVVEATDSPNPR